MMVLPGELRLIVTVAVLTMVVGSLYFVKRVQDSISFKYNKHYVAHRRKTNPCYHCPRPRKYVCDGCYIKLRKEYENGRHDTDSSERRI